MFGVAAPFGAVALFGEREATVVQWKKARKISCEGMEGATDGGG
ncbi:hypothetical protein SLEP1_g4543 [Rubroshorea leprosula]|uniref:Uncharacterized protein n=1 Tax=Rubroshorea leprosula TaxID=152421 RepID=A0AAV5HYT1_9ROSI|nr:hypothetical protein SLEP1_g4543 [Rubroshorea leprosula]